MKCKICGNEKGNKIINVKEMQFGFKDTFEYLECNDCGCLQIMNIPTNISKYYPPQYGINTNAASLFLFNKRNKYLLFQNSLLGMLLAKIKPNIFLSTLSKVLKESNFNKNSLILDVGCGNGVFLSTLKGSGFKNILGVDMFVNEDLIVPGINIIKTSLEDFDTSTKFDLIFLNHSFEHMENPLNVLLKLKKLLKNNGKCIIRIPVKTDEIFGKYKENWVQIDAPRHFYLYTLNSFKLITEKAGFKIGGIVFDSDAFQFYGSEQYEKGIPLKDERSYNQKNFRINQKGIFKKSDIKNFENKSIELNKKQMGDQAIFILER